jgi:transcriptional regulator with GAF, ATPase, and Fis domain/HAMP domain-containing protein
VRSIEFDNRARYTVRYRSVVFGSPKPARPQDVGDSPLVSAGSGRRLRDEILQQTRGAAFAIYREGRLSQSTMSESVRQEHLVMPREAQQHLAADQTYGRRSLDRGQLFETYYPLSGDGWQGAELGVFLGDDGYGEAERLSAIWGAVLLLLSAPILLVLFSDSLSLLGNLRLRLIAVLSAATLVPLGILSVILVGVLEQGHEADLKQGMRQAVTNATAQLREQGRTLQESARSWLDSLVDNPQRIEEVDTLPEAMEGTLENQLPPDWGGGFLRLSFIPDAETPIRPFTRSAGQTRLIGAETPLRPEPAIDVFWGEPILGVSVEREESEGRYTLSAGRSLNDDLLGTLASDRAVLLLGTRGYPLGAAAPASPSSDEQSPSAAELTSNARRPQVMRERMRILEQVLDQGQPVIRREAGWLVGYDVLRDAQETPRALLALVQPDQRAALELPVGRVPVRAFFMLAGGLVVLLSVFLSFLVTSRISRPIERLEQGARALSRGELDVQVEETEERGEIGRLTRTFNQMALELRGRMGDLRLLNRGIQDLSSSTLELSQTIASARSFCSRNSPAHQVRVALLERERNRVELHGELVEPLDLQAPDVRALLTASGPFSMPLGTAHKMGAPVLAEACSPYKSAVVLPMFLGGRAVGAFLLLFEGSEPSPVNLELLTTVATQAATAVVNAQLHRHAVRDPYTGAYIPEHFHRRVVQEVGRAQERGQSLALLGLRLRDRGRFEALGPEGFRRLLERMSTQLQEHLPDGGFMCHRGEGQFEVLLPGVEPAAAQDMLKTWLEDLGRIEGVVGAMARYPEDAVSAEFLFEALAEGFVTTGERARTDREAGPAHQAEGALPLSPGMREVYLTLRKVAPTDLTILLEGETGTGKEILTDTIHRWSRRASGPLVKVHCAALAESLLQSELFGHEKGAFTGATGRKIGKFELAQAGTIFLDEIGEISLEVQVQLLRVLQEREIDRVGGTAPVPVDVRVIAATNRNLVELVRDGRFREDLYYRLQGMVIRVPPLRERKREIPSLVEHFRREALETGHSRVEGFSADAMDELFRRDWPGNIRELRNACFRAMVLASGTRVEVTDLMGILTPEPPPLSAGDPETKPSPAEEPTVTLRPPPSSLRGRLRALHDLVRAEGNLSTQECAAKLGVSSRTSLRDLQELVARGYLERVGKRRGARYRLAQTPSA